MGLKEEFVLADNCIYLMPGQLTIKQVDTDGKLGIYASIYDIKSKLKKAYDKFIEETYKRDIFTYSNAGKDAFNDTWTFDDGSPSVSWTLQLYNLCNAFIKSGMPVKIIFDDEYLLAENVSYSNIEDSDTKFYDSEESKKISASYVWHYKQVAGVFNPEMSIIRGIKPRVHYTFEVVKDDCLIYGVKPLLPL